jgi:hypothetical protein
LRNPERASTTTLVRSISSLPNDPDFGQIAFRKVVAEHRGDLRAAGFVLGGNMASRRPAKTTKPLLTMHDWEAKHYVLAAVIILVVMGMFAYSWS